MNEVERPMVMMWYCRGTEVCPFPLTSLERWFIDCAHFTGKLRGHLRAAAAEGEAEVQQFRLVPEEHLPWPPCAWGQGGLARGGECLLSISVVWTNSAESVFNLFWSKILKSQKLFVDMNGESPENWVWDFPLFHIRRTQWDSVPVGRAHN